MKGTQHIETKTGTLKVSKKHVNIRNESLALFLASPYPFSQIRNVFRDCGLSKTSLLREHTSSLAPENMTVL